MKANRATLVQSWVNDLKTHKLNEHQPARRKGNAKWFVLQRIKEGNPLKVD